MRMHNADIGSLQVKIVFRIHHPVSAPTNPQKGMVLNHRNGAFPEGQPHFRRGIYLRKHRTQTFIEHRVNNKQAHSHRHTG